MVETNRRPRFFFIFIVVIGFISLLTSCLGVRMETVFNADGSGTMRMVFRISQQLLQMGKEEAGVDIPLSKEDLSEGYEEVDGVTVVEVTEEDTEEHRIITAVIDFEDFNALSADEGFPGDGARLETRNGRTELSMLIGQPTGPNTGDGEEGAEAQAELDDAMIAMMQSFLEGYSIEYQIVAPKKIVSYTEGELQKDGRTLLFSMAMGDYVMIEEPYYLKVVW